MIDNLTYITLSPRNIRHALENPELELISSVVKLRRNRPGWYKIHSYIHKNLHFDFRENMNGVLEQLKIYGSMHKYYNEGVHNANAFSPKNFVNTMCRLCANFGVDPRECTLAPFEYGINLTLDHSPLKLHPRDIVANTFCETRKMFSNSPPHCSTSKISGCPGNDSRLKIYSKSDHMPENCEGQSVLRLEIQQKKMRFLNKNGISRLSHLLEVKNHDFLMNNLLRRFNDIVIFDPTILLPIGNRYSNNLIDYSNHNYWLKLIRLTKQGELHSTSYHDHKEKLNNLSRRYGSNIKDTLLQIAKDQYFKTLTAHPMYL